MISYSIDELEMEKKHELDRHGSIRSAHRHRTHSDAHNHHTTPQRVLSVTSTHTDDAQEVKKTKEKVTPYS